jgi:hypothetical protein
MPRGQKPQEEESTDEKKFVAEQKISNYFTQISC